MAKRSREDFEPLSPDSGSLGEPSTSTIPLESTNPTLQTPSCKIIQLDSGGGEPLPAAEMQCSLPPHRQTLSFASYGEYEIHYNQTHVNRCLECRKNFPTEHFLTLHIEENHDALVAVRREKGEKTYSCFIEDCEKKCSGPQKRRMHLIDKHLFPKDYDFSFINDGIDHRTSMLRTGRHRKRSSAAQHMANLENRARRRSSTLDASIRTDGQEAGGDGVGATGGNGVTTPPKPQDASTAMEGLTEAMSSLNFVPPSVRFGRGRGRGRGGFSKT